MIVVILVTQSIRSNKEQLWYLSFLPFLDQRLLCGVRLLLQVHNLLPQPAGLSLNHFKPRLSKLLLTPQVTASHFTGTWMSIIIQREIKYHLHCILKSVLIVWGEMLFWTLDYFWLFVVFLDWVRFTVFFFYNFSMHLSLLNFRQKFSNKLELSWTE